MASFTVLKREKKDGSFRDSCFVRVKEKGKVIFSDTRTFSKLAPAKEWGKNRVYQLETEDEGVDISVNATVAEVMRSYLNDEHIEMNRNKRFALNLISDSEIGKVTISELSAKHVVDYCKDRRSGGIAPSTMSGDISYFRSSLTLSKSGINPPINQPLHTTYGLCAKDYMACCSVSCV